MVAYTESLKTRGLGGFHRKSLKTGVWGDFSEKAFTFKSVSFYEDSK